MAEKRDCAHSPRRTNDQHLPSSTNKPLIVVAPITRSMYQPLKIVGLAQTAPNWPARKSRTVRPVNIVLSVWRVVSYRVVR